MTISTLSFFTYKLGLSSFFLTSNTISQHFLLNPIQAKPSQAKPSKKRSRNIMGVIVDEVEVPCSIPPKRLFKAYVLDTENLIPKIAPIFKSFETLSGDGGVGTIKKLTFLQGDKEVVVKNRTDVLDETNHVYKYTVIEGGDLDDNITSIVHTIKIQPGPDGGSIYKSSCEYHTKVDDHEGTKEKIKHIKAGYKGVIQAVQGYLQANPNEYK